MKSALKFHWLPAPAGLFLAGLKDDPNLAVSDLTSLLSSREAAEAKLGLCGPAARLRVLGRLAAKAAVGRLWRSATAEIRSAPDGRPLSFRPSAEDPESFVSISHTEGAAAAVASARPVGLDLERWRRALTDRAWNWAFAPEERRLAAGAGFFPARLSLWCAKEAAAKSWGLGLLNHLSEVRATGADWPAGRLTAAGPGLFRSEVRLSRWDGYLLALAQTDDQAACSTL